LTKPKFAVVEAVPQTVPLRYTLLHGRLRGPKVQAPILSEPALEGVSGHLPGHT